ncbi:G2/mitotic-specific cyclin 1/2 [Phakopsora pachyrhizi]|nr:G2/mitotic-specific cyclin 1/2 [Phakopsora pachyrhizi]
MAPPTRHSSRLGTANFTTAKKEDENAGALLDRPAGRSLRGNKEAINIKADPSKAGTANGRTGLSTANVRKRILDDRTNKAKSSANAVFTAPLKANGTKSETANRKVSGNVAIRKTVNALDELDEAITKTSIKQPVKRELKPRSGTLTRTVSTTAKVLGPMDRAGPSTKTRTLTRSNSETYSSTTTASTKSRSRAINSRPKGTAASSRKASKTIVAAEDQYGAGPVAKKPRTSEPEEVEKENTADHLASTHGSKGDEIARSKKSRALLDAKKLRAAKAPVKLKEGEDGWEDLDEGDEDDPLMNATLPDPNYITRQNELTWKMRGVLVDWIIEVHSKFRLLPETLYLAINLMDRLLSKRTVALIKFQLVGVTALFLASKYEEVICPSVTNFLYMTDGGYDKEEILKAETYMLEMLDWDLRYPNPLNFLRRISKADHYDIQSRTFAKYFMEISVVDHRLVATTPSLLAATSIWLARKLLDRGCWSANLIHYSGYTESEILPSAQIMVDYILRSGCKNMGMGLQPQFVGGVGYEGGHEHGNLYKKYATRKFFRVSELVREWAVDRYTYETPTGWEWDRLEEWTESSKDRAERERAEGVVVEVQEDEEEEEEGEEEL